MPCAVQSQRRPPPLYPKQRFKVTNWRDYDASLRQRELDGVGGRFKLSSQRLFGGGCDGHIEATFGLVWTGCVRSPGLPGVAPRKDRQRFWTVIARACRARTRRRTLVWRRGLGRDGSGRRAACHHRRLRHQRSHRRSDICRVRSKRSLRSCVRRASECGRSVAGWGGRDRPSRVSYGAMRPLAAAAMGVGRPPRNGTPSALRPPSKACEAGDQRGAAELCAGAAG
jgi:hypothetical protein